MRDGYVIRSTPCSCPPALVPNITLLVDLGCAVDDDGWITTDPTGRTSVPGVWAAGNVVDPRAQVITAAGAGSAAAIAINADLVDGRRAQRCPRSGPRIHRLHPKNRPLNCHIQETPMTTTPTPTLAPPAARRVRRPSTSSR